MEALPANRRVAQPEPAKFEYRPPYNIKGKNGLLKVGLFLPSATLAMLGPTGIQSKFRLLIVAEARWYVGPGSVDHSVTSSELPTSVPLALSINAGPTGSESKLRLLSATVASW
jgi:hypothetical protein